jgi:hypothetical protein
LPTSPASRGLPLQVGGFGSLRHGREEGLVWVWGGSPAGVGAWLEGDPPGLSRSGEEEGLRRGIWEDSRPVGGGRSSRDGAEVGGSVAPGSQTAQSDRAVAPASSVGRVLSLVLGGFPADWGGRSSLVLEPARRRGCVVGSGRIPAWLGRAILPSRGRRRRFDRSVQLRRAACWGGWRRLFWEESRLSREVDSPGFSRGS